MRKIFQFLILLLGFSSCAQNPVINSTPTYVGVLENFSGVYSDEGVKDAIRAIFYKKGRDWVPFKNNCENTACLRAAPKWYPQKIMWKVFNDSKNLGQIEASTPSKFKLYADIGRQELAQGSKVPRVGKPSSDYSGVTGSKVFKPLITLSGAKLTQPDDWKNSKLDSELKDRIVKKLEEEWLNDKNKIENEILKFKFHKVLSNKYGRKIAEFVVLPADDNRSEIPGIWFSFSPNEEPRRLSDNFLLLIEIGDFDSDGSSELLFSSSSYNYGGYILFYDNIANSAKFDFKYH